MSEYITKDQAYDAAMDGISNHNPMSTVYIGEDISDAIDAVLSADVVEVVHAYWDGVAPVVHAEDENGEMQIVYDVFECSRCGCVHLGSPNARWEYCPDCGARMDLELPMCEKEW